MIHYNNKIVNFVRSSYKED